MLLPLLFFLLLLLSAVVDHVVVLLDNFVFRHAALKQEKRLRTRRRNSEFPTERRDPQNFHRRAARDGRLGGGRKFDKNNGIGRTEYKQKRCLALGHQAQLSLSRPHTTGHCMISHARSLDVNRSALAAGHPAPLRDLPVLAPAVVLLRDAQVRAPLVLALLCA